MTQDARKHKTKRDEQQQDSQLVRIIGIFAIVILVVIDKKYSLGVDGIVYWTLCGVILGVDNVKGFFNGTK